MSRIDRYMDKISAGTSEQKAKRKLAAFFSKEEFEQAFELYVNSALRVLADLESRGSKNAEKEFIKLQLLKEAIGYITSDSEGDYAKSYATLVGGEMVQSIADIDTVILSSALVIRELVPKNDVNALTILNMINGCEKRLFDVLEPHMVTLKKDAKVLQNAGCFRTN